MKVTIVNATPRIQRTIAEAARVCYSPLTATETAKNMTVEEEQRVLNTILLNGHHSALEHASITFAVDDISRACSHQLVRHRMASYSQQSQRYVKNTGDKNSYVCPDSIASCEDAEFDWERAICVINEAYEYLVEHCGIPKEDARYLLPNATATNIVVTMNCRQLLHFFNHRCCNRAQWEIRELANNMLALAKSKAPEIFGNAGAPCKSGHCPEGKMSCGSRKGKTESCESA